MLQEMQQQLVPLLLSLAWKDALIFHDYETNLVHELEFHHISYIEYDLTSPSVNLFEIFQDMKVPTVNMLLFCNDSMTHTVIKKMEEHDRLTNVTDLRHSSRVLSVQTGDTDYYRYTDLEVENVAIITLLPCQNGKPSIRTLLFHPGGRVFTQVNTADWPRIEQDTLFPNLKYRYNGRKITVVMKHQRHMARGFVFVENKTVQGFPYRIFDYMCKALNLSYQTVFPKDDVYGKNNNGSWSGIVGLLQRREVDVSSEILTIVSERAEVVDFVFPAIMKTGSFVTYKKENPDDSIFVFTKPFRSLVFLACFASLFIFVALQMFVSSSVRTDNSESHGITGGLRLMYGIRVRQRAMTVVMKYFFELFGPMLRQSTPSSTSHPSERFLVASWWIFCVLISSIYSCSILAALTVEDVRRPFNNPTELVQRTDYKIGYADSTAIGSLIRGSRNPEVIAIRQRVADLSSGDKDVLSNDFAKQTKKVEEGKYGIISGKQFATTLVESNCELETLNIKFGVGYASFAIPKNSPYKQEFSSIMYQLQENGILAKLRHEWISSMSNQTCHRKEFPRPVSITKFRAIFFAVAFGLISALIALVLEIICGANVCR